MNFNTIVFTLFAVYASRTDANAKITYDNFCKAAEAFKETSVPEAKNPIPKPSKEYYEAFLKSTDGMELKESAMFLASCVWSTYGFTAMEQISCKGVKFITPECETSPFHGRGVFQLTGVKNCVDA